MAKRTKHEFLRKYQVKQLFWDTFPGFSHLRNKRKTQNDYPVEVRMAWVDFIDGLHRDGTISDRMAADIIL